MPSMRDRSNASCVTFGGVSGLPLPIEMTSDITSGRAARRRRRFLMIVMAINTTITTTAPTMTAIIKTESADELAGAVAASSPKVVVLAIVEKLVTDSVVMATTVKVVRAAIVGAAVKTDSPLQSDSAMALSVSSLMTVEAPEILVERALASLMLVVLTLKRVFTDTVSESWRTAVESRRASNSKPVMVMSETGTDRAASKPVFFAVL
mmetsp:Transcript_66289/g.177418  ORF Transcript_66289/g.177418 Transcript_66289/m.177418 type:complete len:208 (+) Transcript_66289:989-1612(+)